MPGPQVKRWDVYHRLRNKGYSKESSARIANALARRAKRKRAKKKVKKHLPGQHRQEDHGNWARNVLPKSGGPRRAETPYTGSPIKLRSGEWGARVAGKPSSGDLVLIRTKSGRTWTARVERVLWSGKDKRGAGTVSIVATSSKSSSSRSAASSSSSSTRCDNCQRGVARFDRFDSSGLRGRVCSTCNLEPSYALSFA